MNKQTFNFIKQHKDDNINLLALKSGASPDVDMPLALRQIEGKQKIKNKVPLFYQNDEILYPKKLSLEQASSEITAQYKAELFNGTLLVDLTGGFGIDTYFISQNFEKSIYIEQQEELCELAKHNFHTLGANKIDVKNNTAELFLTENWNADLIYIDPARRKKDGSKAVLLSDIQPNVTELQNTFLKKSENIMMKLSPMFDIVQLQKELNYIAEIHIISVENECKELLVIMKRDFGNEAKIITINFPKNGKAEKFSFLQSKEKITESTFAEEVTGYLYEPNSSILKSGAFKSIGNKLNLHKLQINSHLYTSKILRTDFPGRIFEIKEITEFNKQTAKSYYGKKGNLATRNFPISATELRKKLKLQDGGNDYLFATTLLNNKKVIIGCEKVI